MHRQTATGLQGYAGILALPMDRDYIATKENVVREVNDRLKTAGDFDADREPCVSPSDLLSFQKETGRGGNLAEELAADIFLPQTIRDEIDGSSDSDISVRVHKVDIGHNPYLLLFYDTSDLSLNGKARILSEDGSTLVTTFNAIYGQVFAETRDYWVFARQNTDGTHDINAYFKPSTTNLVGLNFHRQVVDDYVGLRVMLSFADRANNIYLHNNVIPNAAIDEVFTVRNASNGHLGE